MDLVLAPKAAADLRTNRHLESASCLPVTVPFCSFEGEWCRVSRLTSGGLVHMTQSIAQKPQSAFYIL
jgi:hypothetical protein